MSMWHKDGTRHPPVSKVPCQHPECRPHAGPLDLDELEQKARVVLAHGGPWAHPETVLALIERIRAAEGALKSCNVTIEKLVERVEALETRDRGWQAKTGLSGPDMDDT